VTGQAGRLPQGAPHLFQLLIAAQLPLVLLFLATPTGRGRRGR